MQIEPTAIMGLKMRSEAGITLKPLRKKNRQYKSVFLHHHRRKRVEVTV